MMLLQSSLSKILLGVAVLFVLGGRQQHVGINVVHGALLDCSFSHVEPKILYSKKDEVVTLQSVVNEEDETFTMRITYTGGRSYIGIGVNTGFDDDDDTSEGNVNGDASLMSPANVIIGRGYDPPPTIGIDTEMEVIEEDFFGLVDGETATEVVEAEQQDEDFGYTTSIMAYHIISNNVNGTGIIPITDQVDDASFVQTETTSVLTFTSSLHITDYYGKEYTISTTTTSSPTTATDDDDNKNKNNKDKDKKNEDDNNMDGNEDLQDGVDATAAAVSSETTRRSIIPATRWIFAIGLPDNQWVGKHQIHGDFTLDFTPCREINLPPFVDPSNGQNTNANEEDLVGTQQGEDLGNDVAGDDGNIDEDSNTQQDDQDGDDKDASSSNASSQQQHDSNLDDDNKRLSYMIRLMSESTRRKLFLAHGILMFIAWGICCPIAIGVSILRIGITKFIEPKYGNSNNNNESCGSNSGNDTNSPKPPLWQRMHTIINYATVGLTIIAFLLAIIAQKEDDQFHETHHYIGIAVLAGCIIQLTIGYYRVKPSSKRSRLSLAAVISKKRNGNKMQQPEKDHSSSSSLHCLGITSPPSHYNQTFNPKKLFGSYGNGGGGGGGGLSSDESTAVSTPLKSISGSTHDRFENGFDYDTQPYDESPSAPTTPTTTKGRDEDEIEIVFDHPADETRDVATVTPRTEQKHVNKTGNTDSPLIVTNNKNNGDNDSNADSYSSANTNKIDGMLALKEQRVAVMWRFLHRLLGVTLVGLAWYNCHIGMNLSVERWDDQKDWSDIFWGISIGISGMVFLLAFVIRCYL